MNKDYLLSLEYGLLAMASVTTFAFTLDLFKNKLKQYAKRIRNK